MTEIKVESQILMVFFNSMIWGGCNLQFSAWYSLLVGLFIIVQWLFFLSTGQVSELQAEPLRITFHLAGEAFTAVALIIAGTGLLSGKKWGRDLGLAANSMLVYTVIVSPGYFAQTGAWSLVALFAVLLILTAVSIVKLIQKKE